VDRTTLGEHEESEASTATVDRPKPKKSWWQRFLDGKTVPQKLIVAIGALAAASIAIGTIVVAAINWLDDGARDGHTAASDSGGFVGDGDGDEPFVLHSGTLDADRFVQFGIAAARRGDPFELDVQIPEALFDNGSHVRLFYACDDSGVIGDGPCSFVRLEQRRSTPIALDPVGWWLRGCYTLVQDGAGFQAEHLDFELTWVNYTCAPHVTTG
jgi:hypothetical protein